MTHLNDETPSPSHDDATIDALVTGEPVDPSLEHLVEFVHEVREIGLSVPPTPSPALADLIAAGGQPDTGGQKGSDHGETVRYRRPSSTGRRRPRRQLSRRGRPH
jgi:hypothetical protein